MASIEEELSNTFAAMFGNWSQDDASESLDADKAELAAVEAALAAQDWKQLEKLGYVLSSNEVYEDDSERLMSRKLTVNEEKLNELRRSVAQTPEQLAKAMNEAKYR